MNITRWEYKCTTCGFCERLHDEIKDWLCKRCTARPGLRTWSVCAKHGTHAEGNSSCKDCQEVELLQMMYQKNNPFGMAAEQDVNKRHEEAEINNIWAKKLEKAKKRKKDLEDAQIETPKILKELLAEVKK